MSDQALEKSANAIADSIINIHNLINKAQAAAGGPTPVSESLPEFDTAVLVYSPFTCGGEWLLAWRHPEGPHGRPWVWCEKRQLSAGEKAPRLSLKITHWLPLPQNP